MEENADFSRRDDLIEELFEAVATGALSEVEQLLKDGGIEIEAENLEGFTVLQLAVLHSQTAMVRVLLANGASAERAAQDGRTPLIIAAQNGHVPVATLLLEHGAKPDFLSPQYPFTSLWEACANRHPDFARFLVEQGGDVDAKNHDGRTALFCTVAAGDVETTSVLLEMGANRKIRLWNGTTVRDAAAGNEAILQLLETDTVMQGPRITSRNERTARRTAKPRYLPPPRADDENKQTACRGFEVTLVEFFLGEREQRIGISAPVYEVLYGKGPAAILSSARGDQMAEEKPDFTWYHIPCNNMTWVKALITRILAQRDTSLDESLESDLGLTEASESSATSGAPNRVSFSRPICKSLNSRPTSDGRLDTIHIVQTPFLHYETYTAYKTMANSLRVAQRRARESVIPPVPSSLPRSPAGDQNPSRPASSFRVGRSHTREKDGEKASQGSSPHRSNRGTAAVQDHEANGSMTPGEGGSETDNQSNGQDGLSNRESNRGADVTPQDPAPQRRSNSQHSHDTYTTARAGATRPSFQSRRTQRTDGHLSDVGLSEKDTMSIRPAPSKNLNEYLIQGYLGPLQPRRSLDQYIYSQLDSTKNRDNDQVIYRYTKKMMSDTGVKLFMVDQLWMWVLGDDTIISCCPIRWHSWIESPTSLGQNNPRQARSRPPPPGWTSIFAFPDLQASMPRRKPTWPTTIPANVARNPFAAITRFRKERPRAQQRLSISANAADWPILKEDDPLNVHQAILQYLKEARREPMTTVHDLASRIAAACVNVFDPSQVSEDFQFFEFFERSIGLVQDKATDCLKAFKRDLGNSVSWSISAETELVIEVEDILDELHTLEIVLMDQKVTLEKMNETVSTLFAGKGLAPRQYDSALVDLRVLSGHLVRIEHMEKMADKANKLLYHLIDLKQKEASLSAAESARIHAESARRQAEETAAQGRTFMIFTVVTILFLPISFMAAFFTINLDAFPTNEDGRLSLDYVLKYLFGIGFGLSIPLVVIAFNLGAVSSFFVSVKRSVSRLMEGHELILPSFLIGVPLVAILAGTWASKLAVSIKIVVTIVMITFLVLGVMIRAIYWLVNQARTSNGTISGTGTSTSGGIYDDQVYR